MLEGGGVLSSTCLCITTLVRKVPGMNENVALGQLKCLIVCIRDAYEPGLSIKTPPLRLIVRAHEGHASRRPREQAFCCPPVRDLSATQRTNLLSVDDESVFAFTNADDRSFREEEHGDRGRQPEKGNRRLDIYR